MLDLLPLLPSLTAVHTEPNHTTFHLFRKLTRCGTPPALVCGTALYALCVVYRVCTAAAS